MTRLSKSVRRLLLIGIVVLIPTAIALVYLAGQQSRDFILDFDTGLPFLAQAQSTPFNQTSSIMYPTSGQNTRALTAFFSSPSDPVAFTVESQDSTLLKLSKFSGKYLFDTKPSRDILDIKFDTQITAIKLTFATVEHQGGLITMPSDILLIAYKGTELVGSTRAYGSFSDDSYPQGSLQFGSGESFNWVRVSVPTQTSGTTDFLIDNITVTAS